MPPAPVVALEIGTTKVAALVGELRGDGRLAVVGMGAYPSKGVRKGEVVDLETAVVCVKGALQAAEESGQVTIRRIHLALSGGLIQSQMNRGTAHVANSEAGITRADMDRVMDIARAINLPPDREMLHTICQSFCVDDQQNVVNPEGLEGVRLSLDMLALHGVRNRLRNAVRAVQSVPMDVQDVAFSGLCASLAVLTPEQKEVGALIVDLGGGTTSYVAYAGKVMVDAGAIGVGGDHVTNDISLAFNIPLKQAEMLKCESGSSVADPLHRSRRANLPAEVGFTGRSVSVLSLDTVINARVSEIFEIVKSRLEPHEIGGRFGAGIILTGGGARLSGVAETAASVFGAPCALGKVRDADGLVEATENPEYAVTIGLLRYGFANAATGSAFSLSGWLKGLFGGNRS